MSELRTERVTLEIVHYGPESAAGWEWKYHIRPRHIFESVRVVEQAVGSVDDRAYADRMGCDEERDFANRILDQRDAAIRERDELRDKLNRCPECNGEGQHDSGGTDSSGEWINLPCDGCGSAGTIDGYMQVADKLRARVAELEAASGGGEKKPMRMPSREWFARMVDVDEANISVGGLASRVAEVEAASGGGEGEPVAWEYDIPTPHGTGRGVSNLDPRKHPEVWQQGTGVPATDARPLYRSPPQPPVVEQEPVAWGVMVGGKIDRTQFADAIFVDKATAESWCKTDSLQGTGIVVGLYTSHPQPRGWLTERDRKTLIDAVVFLSGKGERGMSEAIEWILARSTPPEVVLPCSWKTIQGELVCLHREVIAALAAAGVAVKEVG